MKKKGTLGGIFAMALILALTFVLSVSSVSATEPTIVDSGNCGKDGSNVTWTLDSTGLLTISGEGEMSDYSLSPDSASGGYITIAPWGSQVNSVSILNGVTSVGDYAFYGCTGLTSMTIPDSVTSIGRDAFSGCTGLISVTIPDSVTSIGGCAFEDCTGLTSVTIPDSVTSIGWHAFSGCTGLTSVTIGSGVTSIEGYAFYGCTGLTSVTVPDSVTSIENYAFYNCTGLTSVIIGSGVTSIESCAFSDCTGLTSVTIGSSVTSIGDSAFSGCTGLKEIIYNARAAECSEYNVFQNAGTAADGMKVVFGESVEKIPSNIFSNCESLTSVTIGSNVTSIGDYAFSYCESLTSVAIGSNVTSIGGYAFSYCKGLTSVTILDSVTSIGDYAFHGCTGLTSVTIPDSVISIGGSVFSGCKGLTSVTIGSNVTSIGGNAFDGCTGLKEVIYNAKAAADLTYNSTVFGWAGTAADGMKVVFGESVEKIPAYLFYNCTGLTSVTIGKNVTSIGNKAFECSNLMEVNYNAKAITDSGCGGDVFLGAGESSSGIRAVIGDGVKKIPAGLFYETNIRSFVFTGNPPAVGAQALGYSNAYALYPVHNSEWTKSAREACGSHLTWIGYCTEPVSSAACRIDQTAYLPNDALNTQGLCMTLTHKDGCTMTIPYDSGLLELGSCDMSTPGAKTIDVTYRGTTAQLKIYVHERKTQTLDKKGYPESSHNYENNLDKTYTYKAAGAVSLDVTFSAQTEVETNIDYLYVNGAQYTGTELAGKTISIQGDTLTIRLVSDKGDSAYGFSIDRIVKTYMEHQYKNGVCTLCGAKDPNFKLAAPTVKPSYVGASGKPYLRWNAVANASKYEVYCATTENGTYTLLGTTTATNYTDNKAGSGYTYYYKVKALAANGAESDYSAVVAGICHCAKPTVKATYMGTTGKPYIKWNAVTGADKYEVYRATSKNGTYTLLGTTTGTNYTDNKAGSGYTYYYKVKALAANGIESDYSAVVAGICHCAKPTVKATYMGATGKPYIRWNAVANVSKYEVYRATSKNGTYTLLGTTTDTNYTDNKAGSGYTYYYKVRAISKVKSSANSVFSTPVAGICHCAKPTVKATYMGTTGKPYIKWNAVANASKYEVYRATSKDGTYTLLGTTTATNYTDNKAGTGYTYYYKVKAISKVKSSANSVFSTPVAGICHCAKPTVKVAATSAGKPRLTWNAVAGASKYYIYRSTEANGTFEYLYTTSNLFYTNSSAKAGTTYYYKVKAVSKVKSSANSVFSTAVSITVK